MPKIPEEVAVEIRRRGALIIAINPDGSESVVCTWERIVRMALGEFKESGDGQA